MNSKVSVALFAAACVFAACQSARQNDDAIAIPAATASTSSRFTAVHEIALTIDSSVRQLPRADGFPIMPRYPHTARRNDNEAFPIVAYIIDANGRIEPRTLTFIVSVEPAFAAALCDWARYAIYVESRSSRNPTTCAVQRRSMRSLVNLRLEDLGRLWVRLNPLMHVRVLPSLLVRRQ